MPMVTIYSSGERILWQKTHLLLAALSSSRDIDESQMEQIGVKRTKIIKSTRLLRPPLHLVSPAVADRRHGN